MVQKAASRYLGLDGARGVAAFTVVLTHCLSVETPFSGRLVERTGAAFLSLGQTSVVFFFVLSGFVLAQKLNKQPQTTYWRFQVARIARLYPPFLVALVTAALLCAWTVDPFFDGHGVVQYAWATFPDEVSAVRQALLVGMNVDDVQWVGPAWSLVYELRAGLVIPIFWAWSRQRSLGMGIAAALALYAFAFLGLSVGGLQTTPFLPEALPGAILATLHYFACFFVGILLSRASLDGALKRVSTPALLAVSFVALAIGTLAHSDLTIAIASAALIAAILREGALDAILTWSPISWLGRMSYPLYLIHLPILIALQHALQKTAPTWLISLVAVLVSLVAAEALTLTIEPWSIALSHRLSRPMAQRRKAPDLDEPTPG